MYLSFPFRETKLFHSITGSKTDSVSPGLDYYSHAVSLP